MAKLNKELKDILDKYGIDPMDKSKLWDCHGTLVLYHKAYEIIAAKEDIKFDPPQIIEGNSSDKIVCICVTGFMGTRKEWSFGEAAPGNCTNKYPYAMAEKRAKDRVIGKLVGLAQYVYSEDEADDFKDDKKRPEEDPRAIKMRERDLAYDLALCKTIKEVEDFEAENKDLPDFIKDDIGNRKAGMGKNVSFPPAKWGFIDVAEAVAFTQEVHKALEEEPDAYNWFLDNNHKLKAIDLMLKAEKYKVNGKTTYERIIAAYNAKFQEAAE